MVEALDKNVAIDGSLQTNGTSFVSKKEELSHPFVQTDSIELEQRNLVDASKSKDQTSSILCSFKTLYDKGVQMTKSAVNIYKKYPFATSMVIFGAVSAVMPATGLSMMVKSSVDAIKNELLSAGIKENDAQTIVDQIAASAQEHQILTKTNSTAVTTGIQTGVSNILGVKHEQMIGNAWNNVFNATLDILTNDVSAVKNLANDHPVIAQCITTGLSIASNIAVGKYTQSMSVACAKSVFSFCTGIFSSKFGTSIFSELKKFIGYGKPDVLSERIMSTISGEHEKVE